MTYSMRRYARARRENVASQARSAADRPALKAKSNTSAPTVATDSAPSAAKRNPFSWMRPEQLEQRIERITSEMGALDARLDDPDLYTDRDASQSVLDTRQKLKEQLEALEEEWLRKAEG